MTNIIVTQMPFAVTRNGLIEARFASVCDAKDFCELMVAKWPTFTYAVIFQFYNDHGALMMHRWDEPMGAGEPSVEA